MHKPIRFSEARYRLGLIKPDSWQYPPMQAGCYLFGEAIFWSVLMQKARNNIWATG